MFTVWVLDSMQGRVVVLQGNKEGRADEKMRSGMETGGEIKLFFVLYLPLKLRESINLLPPSAGDNSTGAPT